MTINIHCPRFEDRERRLFELISSMYPGAPWFKHIAVVWTMCYPSMTKDIENWKNKRKEGFKRALEKYFGKELTKEEINSIPHYFVDSIEARENNNSSFNELCHLLAWAGQLKLIKEDLPAMKVKLGEPIVEKRTRMEYGKTWSDTWRGHRRYGAFGPRSHHGRTYQMQITINEERNSQKFTDGSIEYSDWKEVNRQSNQVTISSW